MIIARQQSSDAFYAVHAEIYVYDYMTKLCRTQAEVILNRVNPNVRGIGQGESRQRKYKRLKHGGGQAYDRSAD
jgi:hypothetical protein